MTEPAAGNPQNYLIRGRDNAGAKQLERVQAHSAQHAINQLTERAFTEVELETDDFFRSLPGGAGADVGEPMGVETLQMIGVAIDRGIVIFTVLPGLLLAIRLALGYGWNRLDTTIGIFLLAFTSLLWVYWNSRAKLYYRMQQQYVKGNFERVLSLVEQYERIARTPQSNDADTCVCLHQRTKALAGLGRISEAIEMIESHYADSKITFALRCSFMGFAYSAVNNHEASLRTFRELSESEPSNPMGWMGMIDPLALVLNQPREARHCLEKLKSLSLSRSNIQMLHGCEGSVLLGEGNFAAAARQLEQALRWARRRKKFSPIGFLLEAVITAELSIAHSRTGDPNAAHKHFRLARPLLELHKIEPLLSRCKRELGIS